MINWTPGLTLKELEKQVILKALKWYGNNKTKTAESLGISVRTIDNKLKGYEESESGNFEAMKSENERLLKIQAHKDETRRMQSALSMTGLERKQYAEAESVDSPRKKA